MVPPYPFSVEAVLVVGGVHGQSLHFGIEISFDFLALRFGIQCLGFIREDLEAWVGLLISMVSNSGLRVQDLDLEGPRENTQGA